MNRFILILFVFASMIGCSSNVKVNKTPEKTKLCVPIKVTVETSFQKILTIKLIILCPLNRLQIIGMNVIQINFGYVQV